MSTIILCGGAGYAEPTGTWSVAAPQHFTNAGPATATFSFTGLTASTPYVLALSWVAFTNRVTNTAWSVAGTAGSPSGTIDQTATPNSFTNGGNQYLYFNQTFTPTGTTLTLTISYPASPSPPGDYVDLVGAYLELLSATLVPTVAAGDFNTGSNWLFGSVPTGSVFAQLNHAMTVVANTTIGDGTNSTVLVCTTVGSSLTVIGCDFTIDGGAATFGSGSDEATYLTVQHSGGTAAGLSLSANSGVTPVVTFQEAAALVFTGTPAARVAVNGKSGAGNAGRFVSTSTSRGLLTTAAYTDFSHLGDASNAGYGLVNMQAGAGLVATWDHCTFDHCGNLTVALADGAADFSLTTCAFTNPAAVPLTLQCLNAITSGTRLIHDCLFMGDGSGNLSPVFGSQTGLTVTQTVFNESLSPTYTGVVWTQFDGNLVRLSATQETTWGGDTTNCYMYWDAASAPNSFFLANDTGNTTFDSNVFEHTDSIDTCVAVGNTDATAADHTITVTKNVLTSNGAGGALGAITGAATATGQSRNTVVNCVHNSSFVGSQGAAFLVRPSFSGPERVGSLGTFKSNLFFRTGTALYRAITNETTAGHAATDAVAAASITNNAYCGVALDGHNVWTDTTGTYPTTGATDCNYNTPYDSPMSGATAPGANDVPLGNGLTNLATQGPQFVDPLRKLATWATHKGYANSAAALAAIQADRTLIADLTAWVRAGFAPQNVALHNTAHDGTDIGAIAYSSPGATTFTLTAPSPAKGDVTVASSNFTVTPDASYTGTITITPSGGGLSTPIVLTFSGSSTPQTFTITPTLIGTVTLTPTNSGSLTNPAAATYLAMVHLGSSGTNIATGNSAPSLGGQNLCSAGVWPQEFARDITSDSVDSSNTAFQSLYGASPLHADFSATGAGGGYGGYGIPFVVVPGTQATKTITYVEYFVPTSDAGPIPIPTLPPCEGWTNQSVSPSSNPSGDGHILIAVRDETTGLVATLWEIYKGWTEDSGATWKAAGAAKFNVATGAQRADDTPSAEAGGMRILPALLRYDEVAAAIASDPVNGDVGHAIRFTMPADQNHYTWPAKCTVNSGTSPGLAMGARLRLTSAWYAANAASYTGQARIIINTIRKYGLIMADIGGTFYFGGVTDDRWDADTTTHGVFALGNILGSALEIVKYTPGWTHTGPTSGPVGTPQTFTVALGWANANAQANIYMTVNGVSSGNVVTLIPGSSPSGTYTFTPPTFGTYILDGATGGLEWFPPQPITFTAPDPTPTSLGFPMAQLINIPSGAGVTVVKTKTGRAFGCLVTAAGTGAGNVKFVDGYTFTDLAIDATNPLLVTSASHAFVASDVGKGLQVTAGTGFTVGVYNIVALGAGNGAILAASPGALGSTGGTYNVGTGLTIGLVAATVSVTGTFLSFGNYAMPFDLLYVTNVASGPVLTLVYS